MKKIHVAQIALLAVWLFASDAMTTWATRRIGRTFTMAPYAGIDLLAYFLLGLIVVLPLLKLRGKFRPQPWLCGVAILLFVVILPFWSGLLPNLVITLPWFYANWFIPYRCLALLLGVTLPLGLFYPRQENPKIDDTQA